MWVTLHCYDIMDRLCGKVKISNPFKDINDKRVILKDMTPDLYVGDNKMDGTQLKQQDIEVGKELIGKEILFMTLAPNKKYDSIEDIHVEMESLAQAKSL